MDTLRLVVDLNRCQSYGQVRLRRAAGLPFPGEESLEYDYAPGTGARIRRGARGRGLPGAGDRPRRSGRYQGDGPDGPGRGAMSAERIVVVGASLAGLRRAEAVRERGFTGELTLIGDKPHYPYDRAPLSKAVLSGRLSAERKQLPQVRPLNADAAGAAVRRHRAGRQRFRDRAGRGRQRRLADRRQLAADEHGVMCDANCRALTTDGRIAEDIHAAGDVGPGLPAAGHGDLRAARSTASGRSDLR
jgi:hypothetical protein